MNSPTDQQLLRDYAGRRSEAAFTQLVQRHIDLVYSAALRMVRDSHLAKDVAQGVFLALAQNAPQLTDRPVLAGWLHRTAQHLAAKVVRSDVRRRAREQEAAVMNELLAPEPDAVWKHIAPHLDDALGELNEGDRDALLLRYFERKSAREMAQTLGTSEDAAQKRVNRAVERLRELFARRGVTVGAGGLGMVISANAVQAAPAGLAAAISTAAMLTGTTIASTVTLTKALAMTALQKTLVIATVVIAVGAGIYEARQAAALRTVVQTLQQEQRPLVEQNKQLRHERDDATDRLASLADELASLKRNPAEVIKLRGDVTRLRSEANQANDPFVQQALAWKAKETKLRKLFEDHPEQRVPELKLLSDYQWLSIAKDSDLDSDSGVRRALSEARQVAKNNFMPGLMGALDKYVKGNEGVLPANLNQLQPYFEKPVDETILDQYKLLYTGKYADVPAPQFVVSDKGVIDDEYDTPWHVGPNGYGLVSSKPEPEITTSMQELSPAVQSYMGANNGQTPSDISQLKPYLATPAQEAAFQKLTKLGVQFGKNPGGTQP